MTFSSKKIISILTVALMVTVVLCAVDTDGATNGTKVNEQLVLGTTSGDVSEYFSEGTAIYEYDSSEGLGTLTLTNAVKKMNTTSTDVYSVVKSNINLKIVVIGENLIEMESTGATNDYGIYCNENLTIVSGDQSKTCSLTVSTEKTSMSLSSRGINVNEKMTITGGVIVTAKAGIANGNGYSSEGVWTEKLDIEGSSLFTYGANSTHGSSYGMNVSGTSTITNSVVVAEASDAHLQSVGLRVDMASITFTESEIHVIAKTCTETGEDGGSFGIKLSDSSTVTFTNTALNNVSKGSAFNKEIQGSAFKETNKIMGVKTGSETEEQITGNVTTDYKSIYTYVTRNITYNTDGGSEVAGQKADSFTKFNLASAPTKAGYTFKGWMDENGTTYQAGAEYTMPGHDITFKAIWEGEPAPPAEKEKSFWDTPGNIAGVVVISLLILLSLGLIIWTRKT